METREGEGRLLTVAEAAEALRLDPSQVRRLAASGKIPCYRLPSLGGRSHYRFSLAEIMETTRVRSAPSAAPWRVAA